MTPQDLYIKPQFQLPERALSRCAPDIQALVLHVSESFDLVWKAARAFASAVSEAFKPIFKLIKCAFSGFYDAGIMKRRRRRYFKVPFKPRRINGRLRAQRKAIA